MRRSRFIFVFDGVMLVALCAVLSLRTTGLAVHELLGVALIAAFVIHLLLSWSWIVAHTRKFLAAGTWRERMNYLLNFGLFVSATIAIFTGIMISAIAFPNVGESGRNEFAWHDLHDWAANLLILLAGLNIALNWDWIVAAIRRRPEQNERW